MTRRIVFVGIVIALVDGALLPWYLTRREAARFIPPVVFLSFVTCVITGIIALALTRLKRAPKTRDWLTRTSAIASLVCLVSFVYVFFIWTGS